MPDECDAVEVMQINQGNRSPQCGCLSHSLQTFFFKQHVVYFCFTRLWAPYIPSALIFLWSITFFYRPQPLEDETPALTLMLLNCNIQFLDTATNTNAGQNRNFSQSTPRLVKPRCYSCNNSLLHSSRGVGAAPSLRLKVTPAFPLSGQFKTSAKKRKCTCSSSGPVTASYRFLAQLPLLTGLRDGWEKTGRFNIQHPRCRLRQSFSVRCSD